MLMGFLRLLILQAVILCFIGFWEETKFVSGSIAGMKNCVYELFLYVRRDVWMGK